MRINTKVRYGLRTMIVIAEASANDGILQKDIAEKQDLSFKYLDSIISSLKLKGLIVNVKGKGSGYKLARPADEITMFDIYTAFERIDLVECTEQNVNCPKHAFNCKAASYWMSLKKDLTSILSAKKLSEIIG